jgi:hypothetical protein
MGDLFSWFAHAGIVRVLSVPVAMGLMLYIIYRLAAPPPWSDEEN